jgi:signal peptidase
MKRTFKCPKCGTYKTLEGKAGEKKLLICDNCNSKGQGSFPKLVKRKIFGFTKKQLVAVGTACILLIMIVSFILIPSMTGKMHFLTVQSGSMEPDINVGDVVVSTYVDPHDIKTGDVITFHYRNSEDPHQCFTHRVSDVIETMDGSVVFETKGDANEDVDARYVKTDELIGKVSFVLPYLGYVGSFARSPAGYFVFIFIPAILIILFEVTRILKHRNEKKTSKNMKA